MAPTKKPRPKVSWNPGWLLAKDDCNIDRQTWLSYYDNEYASCTVCGCKIKFSTQGGQALSFHAKTPKHLKNYQAKEDVSQKRIVHGPSGNEREGSTSSSNTNTGTPSSAPLRLYSLRTQSTKAEILWALKCVAADYSASSCDGIKKLFELMFPNSDGLEHFSLSRTKFTYLLTDGLAPYCRDRFLIDMKDQYFTLGFDETTNEASSKELRIAVRYWSLAKEMIVSSHLRTYFIGRATGEVLSGKLISAVEESSLSLKKILMLGSDGPVVNQKVQRLINEKVKEIRQKPLIDIGTCNIHIAHNAFSYGLEKFGEETADMVILIFDFFDGWPSRKQDFEFIQNALNIPSHNFIKHSPSRWLTLEGAADRLYEQFPAAKRYFLEFIPKNRKELMNRVSYLKIKRYLTSPTSPAELLFVRNSAKVFSEFTRTFQKEEPLIHLLHEELRDIAVKLISRVCKPSTLDDVGVGVCTAALEPDNLLAAKDVVIGDDVAKALEIPEITCKDRLIFSKRAQEHMVRALKHLLEKSALRPGSGIRYFRCLKPQERCSTRSIKDILMVARSLPVDVDVNALRDEWILLQQEKDAIVGTDIRIDNYWAPFFRIKRSVDNQPKYPNVAIVVRAGLALSHGQADLERGFSSSGRTLTSDRASMEERTSDAYTTVKSMLLQFQNKPELVPITNDLITSAEGAHASYRAYMEKQKKLKEDRIKELEKREQEIQEEAKSKEKIKKKREEVAIAESKLKKEQAEESLKRRTGIQLLEEGRKRLKTAIQERNFDDAALAQAMIEAAKKSQDDALQRDLEVKSLQNEIQKEKDKLLELLAKKIIIKK